MMRRWLSGYVIAALGVLAVGCKPQEPAAKPAAEAFADAAVEAILVKADAVDGKADKIISKCPKCNLGMDGKAQHSMTFAGYEMHFCTKGCLKEFEASPKAMLTAMKIPTK